VRAQGIKHPATELTVAACIHGIYRNPISDPNVGHIRADLDDVAGEFVAEYERRAAPGACGLAETYNGPLRISLKSVWHNPDALTRTRTSPKLNRPGSGKSSYRKSSLP
jgi:hypothetical protein